MNITHEERRSLRKINQCINTAEVAEFILNKLPHYFQICQYCFQYQFIERNVL
jgi:hypothetical protein